jgi:hypothetical protein
VFKRYIADKDIQPENSRKYEYTLRTHGWPFWGKAVAKITRDEVQQHRLAVKSGKFPMPPGSKSKGGPDAANHWIQYASMVSSWLLGKRADHAFKGHEEYTQDRTPAKYGIQPKDWPAIASIVARWNSDSQDLFWLHVMLGARPLGTSRMRWDRIQWDTRTYRLTTNREECIGWKPAQSRAWDYPLDSFSLKRLRARQRYAKPGAIFVFPATQRRLAGKAITAKPLGHLFEELQGKLGLPAGMTPYAARRTRGTYSDILFGKGLMTSFMLNHQSDYGPGEAWKYMDVGTGTIGFQDIQRNVERYSEVIQELAGLRPLSAEVETRLLAASKSTMTFANTDDDAPPEATRSPAWERYLDDLSPEGYK